MEEVSTKPGSTTVIEEEVPAEKVDSARLVGPIGVALSFVVDENDAEVEYVAETEAVDESLGFEVLDKVARMLASTDSELASGEVFAPDEVLLISVDVEGSVNGVKILGFVEELNSEVVLRSDEILDSVGVLEAVEKLVSLKLLRLVELGVDRNVMLGSKEKLDSDVDVSVEIKL